MIDFFGNDFNSVGELSDVNIFQMGFLLLVWEINNKYREEQLGLQHLLMVIIMTEMLNC